MQDRGNFSSTLHLIIESIFYLLVSPDHFGPKPASRDDAKWTFDIKQMHSLPGLWVAKAKRGRIILHVVYKRSHLEPFILLVVETKINVGPRRSVWVFCFGANAKGKSSSPDHNHLR